MNRHVPIPIVLAVVYCLLLLSGCRSMRSGSAYEKGLDILLPLTTETGESQPEAHGSSAEKEKPPSVGDSGEEGVKTKEEEAEDDRQREAVTVDELTSATNAPPRLVPGVRIDVTVAVGDRAEILVKNRPISPQGELELPLIKVVKVGDLTRKEGIEKLTGLYKEYFLNPEVRIIFSQFEGAEAVSPWGYVTVTGRVKQPRRIALTASGKLTLSQAVTMAGGLATSAKDKSVRITRRCSDGTIEKQSVNLRKIVSSGQLENDIVLQDGDIVFVPETLF